MNLYNEEVVKMLLAQYGLEKTQLFCEMQAQVFEMEHQEAFDDAFYENKWWKDKANQLSTELSQKPKTINKWNIY